MLIVIGAVPMPIQQALVKEEYYRQSASLQSFAVTVMKRLPSLAENLQLRSSKIVLGIVDVSTYDTASRHGAWKLIRTC